jgi:TolB protein
MRLISALMILAIAGSTGAQTDVHLKVTTEGYARIRIGFAESKHVPSGRLADYWHEFSATLRRDIDITGYFDIVKNLEADRPHAIVESDARQDRDDLRFEIDLKDGISEDTVFRRRYGSATDQIATVAHIVADDIVYALTGRSGIANTHIAFVAGEKGKSHLYTVHIDGSQLLRHTQIASIVMSPSWSPDGTRIAYVSYEEGNPAIYVTDTSNSSRTRFVSFGGLNATPAWSPDGRRIALTLGKDGNPEIYVVSLDGSLQKRITHFSGIDCSPTWAPNGLELAFTSDRAGSPQIFIVDTEGFNIRRITSMGNYNTSPAWSPEGDLIAYVSRIDGRFQICTVDPFGITTHVLTEKGDNEDPEWSPDGMRIVFCSTVRGNSSIYIMNRDGTQKRRILEGVRHARNPAWSPPLRYREVSQSGG